MIRHLREVVFSSIFPIVVLLVGACASTRPAEPFYTRIYQGSYDQVWLAMLKALNDYPLKLSNKDTGKVQSEVVNGPYNDLMFTYPDPLDVPDRFRYSLKFTFAKLEDDASSPLIRIRAIKELERFQDFYAGWKPYPSDGLEERVILYRVEHILQMQKHLEEDSRAQEAQRDAAPDKEPAQPVKKSPMR